MENIVPCAAGDREVFRRVWQRVMGGRPQGDCPVEALPDGPEGDLSCACLEDLLRRDGGRAGPAASRGEGPEPPAGGAQTGGTAEPDGEGSAAAPPPPPAESAPHGPREAPPEEAERTARLRRQVTEALESWQFYRFLARRARGSEARSLSALAGEEHRAARKLAAAYFLLTGLRYWPSELLAAPVIPSYWGALRGRYQAERQQEAGYRAAGDGWDDPDMAGLYRELAEGCRERCRRLRLLLESDHTV